MSHGGTPASSILDWDFPWNKPSIKWGPPIYGNLHIVMERICIHVPFLWSQRLFGDRFAAYRPGADHGLCWFGHCLLRATKFLSLFTQIFSGVLWSSHWNYWNSHQLRYFSISGLLPRACRSRNSRAWTPRERYASFVEARGMVAPETVGGHGKGGHETGRDVEILP